MPHKVMCGKDTMKAAGTVTKALAKWLAEKGLRRGHFLCARTSPRAAADLPAAQNVLDLLERYVDEHYLIPASRKSRITSGSRRSNPASSG